MILNLNEIKDQNLKINVSDFASATYVLRIETEVGTEHIKFIKN
mgnify:FL=1